MINMNNKALKLGLGMVYLKKHYSEGYLIIAVCDAELLGKTIIDKNKNIRFYVDPYFYKGELLSLEKALEELEKADIANLVGRRIVSSAIEKNLIHREAILEINGIPHAQFVVIRREGE